VSSDPKDFTTEDTVRQHTLYVYGSDANFAAFNTLMLSTLKAYKPATTVSDPKALEIVS
jgi:hypothetical protein